MKNISSLFVMYFFINSFLFASDSDNCSSSFDFYEKNDKILKYSNGDSNITKKIIKNEQKQNKSISDTIANSSNFVMDNDNISEKRITENDMFSLLKSSNDFFKKIPNFNKGFLRGGLRNHIKTFIEGVDISDLYYPIAFDQNVTPLYKTNAVIRFRESQNSSLFLLNPNSINEINVITGMFDAEYPSAISGIVNYCLKRGDGDIKGKVTLKSGAKKLSVVGPDFYNDKNLYFGERDLYLSRMTKYDSILAKKYTWKEGIYEIGQVPFEADILLEGNIFENVGFNFSTNFKNNPDCRLPNEKYKELNTQIKIDYNLEDNTKFTFLGILFDKGKLFGWKNTNYQELWKYYLQGVPQYDGLSWLCSVKLTHFISSEDYYDFQFNVINNNNRYGYVDGNNDGVIQLNEKGDFITFSNLNDYNKYVSTYIYKAFELRPPGGEMRPITMFRTIGNYNYYLERPDIFYENFKNNSFTTKFNFTKTINTNHEVKVGVLFSIHSYNMDRKTAYFSISEYPYESWNIKPIELASYIQDKIRFNNLFIYLGLRFELWNTKTYEIRNLSKPYYLSSENTPFGIINRYRSDRVDIVKPYLFFSPRLGISYNIFENLSTHFSVSKLNQQQPFSLIYSNYDNFIPLNWYTLGFYLSGKREPYKSTNFEIGFQSKISNMLLYVTGYYNKIENYFDSSFLVRGPMTFYYYHYSKGTVYSKGIEILIDKINLEINSYLDIFGRFSYVYSKVKSNADLVGGSSTLSKGYNRDHQILFDVIFKFPYEFSINSNFYLQSGFWYTKNQNGNEYDTAPWNKRIDLLIQKSFMLSSIKLILFADIKNLLNAKNIIAYDDTITGNDLWQKNGDPTGIYKRPINLDGTLYYDIPREVYLGIQFEF